MPIIVAFKKRSLNFGEKNYFDLVNDLLKNKFVKKNQIFMIISHAGALLQKNLEQTLTF